MTAPRDAQVLQAMRTYGGGFVKALADVIDRARLLDDAVYQALCRADQENEQRLLRALGVAPQFVRREGFAGVEAMLRAQFAEIWARYEAMVIMPQVPA